MTLTPKQRAINKAKSEINKDISRLIQMAKSCGLGELLYLFHYLHFTRLTHEIINVPEDKKEMLKIYGRRLEDAFKYQIQILAKHAQSDFVKTNTSGLVINSDLVEEMQKHALEINSKFESVSFISTFNTVEISGQRDQHAKIKLTEIKDEYLSKFFKYNFRADKEHSDERTPQLVGDFFNFFTIEYKPYSDLFLKEFKITIEEFIEFTEWLINNITQKITSKQESFPLTASGKVDIHDYRSIILYGSSLLIEKEEIYAQFGEKIKHILNRLIFNISTYDEQELKYNIVERQPLIEKDGYLAVSPELLLDSFYANSHYSLLEAGAIKEEYKKRYSKVFVDKILLKAEQHGFREFSRDFELYEGKNQIGDIDLIVTNDKNEFLLIEAKNHSVPMDVYVHDFEATKARLKTLQKEWEEKVKRRVLNLQKNYENYGICKNFKYIIVSKSPEIISHFSDFLFLSLREFGTWVSTYDLQKSFADLYEQLYKLNDTLTKKQLNSITKDLLSHWTLTKE